jgi:hypothetical protein
MYVGNCSIGQKHTLRIHMTYKNLIFHCTRDYLCVNFNKLDPTWMTSLSLINTLHIDCSRFTQCVVDLTLPYIKHIYKHNLTPKSNNIMLEYIYEVKSK